MLEKLNSAMQYALSKLNDTDCWNSLVINRRKPFTYRMFTQWDKYRICLHRFEQCDPEESFFHPHGWQFAACILKGGYNMQIGYSNDRESKPKIVCNTKLSAGSRYEILEPMTWHAISPYLPCYTIMINGEPFDPNLTHKEVRTTKGKDLQEMSQTDIETNKQIFRELLIINSN